MSADTKILTAKEAGVAHRFGSAADMVGDEEGLMISNYEQAGRHAAERIYQVIGDMPVLEVCTGIGATTYVLAQQFPHVITVDRSGSRHTSAQANIHRLGLLPKVTFLTAGILDDGTLESLAHEGLAAAYTDVDWTQSGDWRAHETDIDATGPSTRALHAALRAHVTGNICMKLPKTINIQQLRELGPCEIEHVMPDGRLSFYLVYFGDLVRADTSEFEFRK